MKHGIFYGVADVMEILDYKRIKAYGVIKELNKELEDRGFKTRPGLIPKKYFNERYGLV